MARQRAEGGSEETIIVLMNEGGGRNPRALTQSPRQPSAALTSLSRRSHVNTLPQIRAQQSSAGERISQDRSGSSGASHRQTGGLLAPRTPLTSSAKTQTHVLVKMSKKPQAQARWNRFFFLNKYPPAACNRVVLVRRRRIKESAGSDSLPAAPTRSGSSPVHLCCGRETIQD